MKTSEKQALEKLVEMGVISHEIAEIISTMARDKVTDLPELEGTTVHPLILLLDKSGSMENLKDSMIAGQHHLINSLLGASSSSDIYLGQVIFNHQIEHFQDVSPFRDEFDSLQLNPNIKLLNDSNYIPEGGTKLYDTLVHAIAMLAPPLLIAEELGQQVLAHIAIITDGKDEHSIIKDTETLKKVMDYVLDNGIIHRITLIGIGNYDYEAIGKAIGIQHVIEVEADPTQIRAAMDIISSHVSGDR